MQHINHYLDGHFELPFVARVTIIICKSTMINFWCNSIHDGPVNSNTKIASVRPLLFCSIASTKQRIKKKQFLVTIINVFMLLAVTQFHKQLVQIEGWQKWKTSNHWLSSQKAVVYPMTFELLIVKADFEIWTREDFTSSRFSGEEKYRMNEGN